MELIGTGKLQGGFFNNKPPYPIIVQPLTKCRSVSKHTLTAIAIHQPVHSR